MHPLEHVRLTLNSARRAGLGFSEAWEEAVQLAPAQWRSVLQATRAAWQDAYGHGGAHRLADLVEFRRAAGEHDRERPTRGVRLVA